uniref:ORF135 protein n=1 Tax=Mankyua chejuensis TaxID=996148 RepID=H8Y615_9MONI|nr:hypothetical protein MACHC_p032 [Mankyua chejuensis]ADZ47983.1 hypothetical protein [Mankyua chejuensis]AJJ48613.1 ORF135 [Mankyua chejuensis]
MADQAVYHLIRYVRVNAEDPNKQSALKTIYDTTRTFMYIGLRLSQELYKDADVRRICHILSNQELTRTNIYISDIVYTVGQASRQDHILGRVTLTLKPVVDPLRVPDNSLKKLKFRKVTLFYNRLATSSANVTV